MLRVWNATIGVGFFMLALELCEYEEMHKLHATMKTVVHAYYMYRYMQIAETIYTAILNYNACMHAC